MTLMKWVELWLYNKINYGIKRRVAGTGDEVAHTECVSGSASWSEEASLPILFNTEPASADILNEAVRLPLAPRVSSFNLVPVCPPSQTLP